MNCPTCNVPLLTSDRQGVEIDYCPNCRGIWLDHGELDKITQRSVTAMTKWYQFINDTDDAGVKQEHGKNKKRFSWRFVHYWITKFNTLRIIN